MTKSSIFEFLCEQLEHETGLTRPQAGGALRMALRKGGLDPAFVTVEQAKVAISKLLTMELRMVGIAVLDGETITHTLLERLDETNLDRPAAHEAPEALFRRLESKKSKKYRSDKGE